MVKGILIDNEAYCIELLPSYIHIYHDVSMFHVLLHLNDGSELPRRFFGGKIYVLCGLGHLGSQASCRD